MSEAQLRERIEYLEAENANLRDELGRNRAAAHVLAARRKFGVTPKRAELLLALIDGRQRSYDALRDALWDDRAFAPESNVLGVHIWALRSALAPHGIKIENIHGYGLQMSPDDCAKVRAILGIEAKP